jgi:predicted Fe-Mo cluster-binding NifX family protein
MNEMLKIAIVTKNGQSIVGTFGSSKYFKVFEIENKQIKNEELREVYVDKASNEVPQLISKANTAEGGSKYSLKIFDPSKEKHMKIAKSISDCNVVIARGMCANAWDSVEQFKMEPIITKNKDFHTTVYEYINNTLVNHKDRIH